MSDALRSRLQAALAARAELLARQEFTALRLFNGFTEGWPDLAADLYGQTLVLHDYSGWQTSSGAPVDWLTSSGAPVDWLTSSGALALDTAQSFYRAALPALRAVFVKPRRAADPDQRRGRLVWGGPLDRRVREGPVQYALDLSLNRDASLYLDTRLLRAWAYEHLAGKRVLNTFAYTGSLGVAAAAGGAASVLHLDLNRAFLNLAKQSYALNGLAVRRRDFLAGDFWTQINTLKRAGAQFDCIFLDPPFFSSTQEGRVDLENGARRVINKVRPLLADGGLLVAINNALFVSGAQYLSLLQDLGQGGYLELEATIPVPPDFTGYPATCQAGPPVDPAPFNHPTKIALLRARRKSGLQEAV